MILREKRKMNYFVKYLGFPATFNFFSNSEGRFSFQIKKYSLPLSSRLPSSSPHTLFPLWYLNIWHTLCLSFLELGVMWSPPTPLPPPPQPNWDLLTFQESVIFCKVQAFLIFGFRLQKRSADYSEEIFHIAYSFLREIDNGVPSSCYISSSFTSFCWSQARAILSILTFVHYWLIH